MEEHIRTSEIQVLGMWGAVYMFSESQTSKGNPHLNICIFQKKTVPKLTMLGWSSEFRVSKNFLQTVTLLNLEWGRVENSKLDCLVRHMRRVQSR